MIEVLRIECMYKMVDRYVYVDRRYELSRFRCVTCLCYYFHHLVQELNQEK